MAKIAPKIQICIKKLGMAYTANDIFKKSNQKTFRQFRNLAKSWLQISKKLTVQWISGHAKIERNKLAD